jgi:hypothetical protein
MFFRIFACQILSANLTINIKYLWWIYNANFVISKVFFVSFNSYENSPFYEHHKVFIMVKVEEFTGQTKCDHHKLFSKIGHRGRHLPKSGDFLNHDYGSLGMSHTVYRTPVYLTLLSIRRFCYPDFDDMGSGISVHHTTSKYFKCCSPFLLI